MDISYYKQFEPIDGKWYINRELGRGAFGAVYEVERNDYSKMKSAMKIITIPSGTEALESFRRENFSMTDAEVKEYYFSIVQEYIKEFQLMSKLKGNSNIVSYEDHNVIERKDYIGWDIFIRMELLSPMMDYFKNHYTSRQVIKLGIDICKALEVCQKHNIIHRDIKPTNIFVSQTGDFKLGDFGVARILEKSTSHLSTKGTYTYMAPEVCRGDMYTAVADIYSLGIVMYKLLNNNLEPFRTNSDFSDAQKALELRLQGYKMKAPVNADARLSEIILKACSFNPAERYQTPLQMRMKLQALLDGKYVPEAYSPKSSVNTVNARRVQPGINYANNSPNPRIVSQRSNSVPNYANMSVPKTYNSINTSIPLTDGKPSAQPPQKKKKTSVIVSASLALVLGVVGVLMGVYLRFNSIYAKAVREMRSEDYESARELFSDIMWFKDSGDMVKKCDFLEAEILMDENKLQEAIEIFEKLKSEKYEGAEEKYTECLLKKAEIYINDNEANKALEILSEISISKNGDLKEKAEKCKYDVAMLLYEDGEYEKAKKIFSETDNSDMIKECDYRMAIRLRDDGDYAEALSLFASLNSFADSKRQFSVVEDLLIAQNSEDITFSTYENIEGRYQDEDGNYVEYTIDHDGELEAKYNLPHEKEKYFKVEDGVHYHGSDGKGWSKQWIYQKISRDEFMVYNYNDKNVYKLNLE